MTTVIIARAEFDRHLTREEGDAVRRAMVVAGHEELAAREEAERRMNAFDRMTRDGATYIGDGPYGA